MITPNCFPSKKSETVGEQKVRLCKAQKQRHIIKNYLIENFEEILVRYANNLSIRELLLSQKGFLDDVSHPIFGLWTFYPYCRRKSLKSRLKRPEGRV